MSVHIGVLSLEVHIPESGSLKSKRSVLKSLKDRLRSKFNVSVAEVEDLDKWQKSGITVCMVGNDKARVDGSMQGVLSYIEQERDLRVVDHDLQFA